MNSENEVLTNETTYKDTFDASFSFIAIFLFKVPPYF